jgi:hypothetical protein
MRYTVPDFADLVENFYKVCSTGADGSYSQINRYDRVQLAEHCGYIIQVMAIVTQQVQQQGFLGPSYEKLKLIKFPGQIESLETVGKPTCDRSQVIGGAS